jgi:hypothetical protein
MNTLVWLITFQPRDGMAQSHVYMHNCIADYRLIDPDATVQQIDCAAVAALVDAAKEAQQLLELALCIGEREPAPGSTGHKLRAALALFDGAA